MYLQTSNTLASSDNEDLISLSYIRFLFQHISPMSWYMIKYVPVTNIAYSIFVFSVNPHVVKIWKKLTYFLYTELSHFSINASLRDTWLVSLEIRSASLIVYSCCTLATDRARVLGERNNRKLPFPSPIPPPALFSLSEIPRRLFAMTSSLAYKLTNKCTAPSFVNDDLVHDDWSLFVRVGNLSHDRPSSLNPTS